MTTLKRVDKEDLEEGREYIYVYDDGSKEVGKVDLKAGYWSCEEYGSDLCYMEDNFFGPIELEE